MDDNPLSFLSLMFLKRSLAAELGDTVERFVMKLKRVKHQGFPALWITLERKSESSEAVRVISKHLASGVDGAVSPLTGDELFDRCFMLAGANELECAVFLGAETRKLLLEINENAAGLDVEPGLATILFRGSKIARSGKLAKLITDVIGIMDGFAGGMADDAANKGKIIRNLREEGHPGVRLCMLKALLSFYSVDDEITGLLEKLSDDVNPEVRIEAAARLGERGRAMLIGMLDDLPVRKSGIASLIIGKLAESDGELPGNLVKKLAMKSHDPDARVRVEALIRQQGDHHPPSFFRKIFEKNTHRDTRRALFDAIVTGVRLSNREWDGFFTGGLADIDRHVRTGSLRMLGDKGGPECIEALRLCAEPVENIATADPLLVRIAVVRRDRAERDEARRAIERIRSRHEGAEGGWLSVVEVSGKDGALSIADTAGEGALSAEDEKGPGGARKGDTGGNED
jgi:hypothetical protein